MNPFVEHKILSYYHEAREILAGHIPPPRMVSLWLTTICNYSCPFCLFRKENKEQHAIADTRKTIRMIDDLIFAGIRSLEFSGGGEPTLHPDFQKIAEYAFDAGLKLGLLTNGSNLHYDILGDFRYVRIGLDAADEESYAEIKRPAKPEAFKTVRANICELIKAREGRQRPRIGIKFLLNKKNYLEIERMINLSVGLHVDYVHFKGEHNGPDVLSTELAKECERRIDQTRDNCRDIIEIFGSPVASSDAVACFMSPIHTVIDPTGNVFICCYLKDEDHVIGNAFEHRFEDFWGKNGHHRMLNRLTVSVCQKWDCRWKRYNKIMHDIMVDDSVDIDFI